MTKTDRPFEAKQLRTNYRKWALIATPNGVTCIKGKQSFELKRRGFAVALKAGKDEIDRREGAENWDSNYTDGALR